MTQHTPINYKNEYYKLLEENQSLRKQVGDLHTSKETIHSFYCDKLYERGRVIAFLCIVVAIETIFLWGLL